MKVDYSSYNRHTYPVIIFDSEGTLIYMNESAHRVFGDFDCGEDKCHYIFRGFEAECKNYINCVCGREVACTNGRASFVREAKTLDGNAFFIVERYRIQDSSHYMEYLYDITQTAASYISNGWMTKDELENMMLDTESKSGSQTVKNI
ncbi:MAG: hypothetical protein AB7E48_10395 [Deferribacterales bacterium]